MSLDTMTSNKDELARLTTNDTEHENKINADEYFSDRKTEVTDEQQPRSVETTESSEDLMISKKTFAELNQTIENLRDSCDIEAVQIQTQGSLIDTIEQRHKEELDIAIRKINELHIQQKQKEEQWINIKTEIDQKYQTEKQNNEQNLRLAQEQNIILTDEIKQIEQKRKTLKEIEKNIQTISYSHIPIELMHDFIMPKFDLLDDYLKKSVQNINEYLVDRIPRLTCGEENSMFKVTLTGFPNHHSTYNAAFKRLINLSNSYNSAKEYYQRYLQRIIKVINKKLIEVKTNTHSWKQYIKILHELLEEKKIEYVNRFTDYIREKSKLLIEQSIRGISNPPWIELRVHTDDFLQRNPFENEIIELKNRALEEFIKQNISFQRLKTDRIPTRESVNTVKYFIEQIKTTLKSNLDYQGFQVQHLNLIPNLLQQIMIYYSCFTVQLPLFESCRDLLGKIETNTITTITTSTGSGKKTI